MYRVRHTVPLCVSRWVGVGVELVSALSTASGYVGALKAGITRKQSFRIPEAAATPLSGSMAPVLLLMGFVPLHGY